VLEDADIKVVEEGDKDYYTKESKNIPGLLLKIWGKIS